MRIRPVSVAKAKETKRRHRIIASIAIIISAACWGLGTVMSRDLLDTLSPPGLLVIQLTASLFFLLLLSLRDSPWKKFDGRFCVISLSGLLEPGFTYVVGLIGLGLTTAGNASIIGATEPIITVLLAWICFGNRPSRKLFTCITVAFIGLILVSWNDIAHIRQMNMLGDGLILLSTILASGYTIVSSRFTKDYTAATLATGQQTVGLIFAIIVFLLASLFGFEPKTANPLTWQIFIYAAISGIVQYAISFWLYLYSLRYLSIGKASLWLTVTPIFGLTGAMLWLGERPEGLVFFGAILIILSITISRQER